MAKNVKRITTEISDINASGVMEMTEREALTPDHIVEVPEKFKAYVYINEKAEAVLSGGSRLKLRKYYGDKTPKSVKVLFVNEKKYTAMSWGIGNIQLNYSFGNNGFVWNVNVGANGTFVVEITNDEKFFESLGKPSGVITNTETVSRLTSYFREIASKVLKKLFADAITPVFDSGFIIDEYEKLLREETEKKPFADKGIVFRNASVADIRINDADIKNFRNRLREQLEAGKLRKRQSGKA